jgi:hypothetical protein
METKIEEFISHINEIVETSVRKFIEHRIDTLLQDMSKKYNISYEQLSEDYKNSCNVKISKCTVTTTLGHTCKYDAIPNETICRKHYNKRMRM